MKINTQIPYGYFFPARWFQRFIIFAWHRAGIGGDPPRLIQWCFDNYTAYLLMKGMEND